MIRDIIAGATVDAVIVGVGAVAVIGQEKAPVVTESAPVATSTRRADRIERELDFAHSYGFSMVKSFCRIRYTRESSRDACRKETFDARAVAIAGFQTVLDNRQNPNHEWFALGYLECASDSRDVTDWRRVARCMRGHVLRTQEGLARLRAE